MVESAISVASELPLVFYELDVTDPNAPWTSGPGTFIDTMIRTAGGENLGSTLQGFWIQVSLEELIRLDPEVIILGDYTLGGVTPEMVAQRAGWEGLKAVIEGQVYTFDDNLVSRPGPRLLDGLEAMARLLHPELFKSALIDENRIQKSSLPGEPEPAGSSLSVERRGRTGFHSPGNGEPDPGRPAAGHCAAARLAAGLRDHPVKDTPAAYRSHGAGWCRAGKQWCGLPGSVPQSAGRPLPDRSSLGCRPLAR